MATEGFLGFYIETHDYPAAAAFWRSMGFEASVETDHHSGQWVHPNGGPYVFINEQDESHELRTHPILRVVDACEFAPQPAPRTVQPFTPQHWAVTESIVSDPDGRDVSLQAPLPEGG